MTRFLVCIMFLFAVGLLAMPAYSVPGVFSDDFTTLATYDYSSWLSGCTGMGPQTKYTVFEYLLGDIASEHAVTGGYPPGKGFGIHELSLSNSYSKGLGPQRFEIALLGELNLGPCIHSPWYRSTIEFTQNDVCIYGGWLFSPFQLRDHMPGDLDGDDDLPGAPLFDDDGDSVVDGTIGVAGEDDDADGLTDEYAEVIDEDELLINLPVAAATGKGRIPYPRPPGAAWPHGGPDGAPGDQGIDDDANGITDDIGELAWPSTDDGDDHHGRMYWYVLMRSQMTTTSTMWLNMDAGSDGNSFALRRLRFVEETQVEAADEWLKTNYQPNTYYNYVFCGSGTVYGAMMWTDLDSANPNETLGPVGVTGHNEEDSAQVGFLAQHSHEDPTCLVRQQRWTGNTLYDKKFWVIGDGGNLPYGQPYVTADFDENGSVDGQDFMKFSACFNGSLRPPKPTCVYPEADFDRDGDVDGQDFMKFSKCFNGSLRKPKCSVTLNMGS